MQTADADSRCNKVLHVMVGGRIECAMQQTNRTEPLYFSLPFPRLSNHRRRRHTVTAAAIQHELAYQRVEQFILAECTLAHTASSSQARPITAAPQRKASVFGRNGGGSARKGASLWQSGGGSARKGISLWQSGGGSAGKGGVCLPPAAVTVKQRHPSLAEWQQKRKQRQCLNNKRASSRSEPFALCGQWLAAV